MCGPFRAFFVLVGLKEQLINNKLSPPESTTETLEKAGFPQVDSTLMSALDVRSILTPEWIFTMGKCVMTGTKKKKKKRDFWSVKFVPNSWRKKKSRLALLGLNVWGSGAPAAETPTAKRSGGQKEAKKVSWQDRFLLLLSICSSSQPKYRLQRLHGGWVSGTTPTACDSRPGFYSHGAVTSVFQGISQACGRPRRELLREPTRRSASGNMKKCCIAWCLEMDT